MASLVNGGYKLRYLDFDGNTKALSAYIREPKGTLDVVSCIDRMRVNNLGSVVCDGKPTAYSTALSALSSWPSDGSHSTSWDERTVLVVDSGTFMGEALLRRQLNLNNREGKKATWNDYQNAQSEMKNFLMLCKTLVPCHLIFNTHLVLIGPDLNVDVEDEGLAAKLLAKKLEGAEDVPWRYHPNAVGKAISDKIAAYFDGTLLVATSPRGRKIFTKPTDGFDAGVPVPGLPSELDLSDGLLKIFNAIDGGKT